MFYTHPSLSINANKIIVWAKRFAKHAVDLVRSHSKQNVFEEPPPNSPDLSRLTNQMRHGNLDVKSCIVIPGRYGYVCSLESALWVPLWLNGTQTPLENSIICLPPPPTWAGDQVKSVGTPLVIAEILRTSGDEKAQQIRNLIKDINHFGKVHAESDGGTNGHSLSTGVRASALSDEIIVASNCSTMSWRYCSG